MTRWNPVVFSKHKWNKGGNIKLNGPIYIRLDISSGFFFFFTILSGLFNHNNKLLTATNRTNQTDKFIQIICT